MADTPTWRGRAPSPERGAGDGVPPVWDRPRDRQACLVLPPIPAEVLRAVERRGVEHQRAAAWVAEPMRAPEPRRRRFPTPRGMAFAEPAFGAPRAALVAPAVVPIAPVRPDATTLSSLRTPHAAGAPAAWLEHPLAIGLLVVFLPPAGLLALWSSAHRAEAKWSVTGFLALAMVLGAMLALAALLTG